MNRELETKIYNLMCASCPNAKRCHDNDEYCNEFLEKYEKQERKLRRNEDRTK